MLYVRVRPLASLCARVAACPIKPTGARTDAVFATFVDREPTVAKSDLSSREQSNELASHEGLLVRQFWVPLGVSTISIVTVAFFTTVM